MKPLRCSVCHSCVRRADAFASANLLKVLMKVTLLSPDSRSVKDRNPCTWFRRGTRRSSTRYINSSLVPGMRSYERIIMYIVLRFLVSSLAHRAPSPSRPCSVVQATAAPCAPGSPGPMVRPPPRRPASYVTVSIACDSIPPEMVRALNPCWMRQRVAV